MAQQLSLAQLAAMKHALGLDQPILVQYADWLGALTRGNWGFSLQTFQPVTTVLSDRLPVTGELTIMGTLLAVALAVPLGVWAAVRRGSIQDTLATVFGLIGLSTPNIFSGVVLIYVFAYRLRLLPIIGYVSFVREPLANLGFMLLPAITIGTTLMGSVMRITRTAMLEVLSADYITTARSKGLRERAIIYRHALKNAFIPVLTVLGLHIGGLLGGAVIVEEIFSLPGVGSIVVNAIFDRDYPVIEGAVLLFAFVFVILNLIVDLCYGWLDPRIRFS
jgi:peptide/nickel transport system permease protein